MKEICPQDLKGTCPGTFTLAYTFAVNLRPRRGDNPMDLRNLGMSFNVYVTPRIFLELDQSHVISQQAAGQPRVTGVGDSGVVTGLDVSLEGKKAPGVALLYGVKLPTASVAKGLGSGKADQQVTANIHKTFGKTYLEYDTSLILVRVPNTEGTRVSTLGTSVMSGVLQRSLTPRQLLHFQLDATLSGHSYKSDLAALSFWQTRLNDHVSLRLGGGAGLTSNAPRAGFYLAFIWEDNLRRWGRR